MGWSPPKKSTVNLSMILVIVGIILSFLLSSWSFIDMSGFTLDPNMGLYIALAGWVLLFIGIKFPGI